MKTTLRPLFGILIICCLTAPLVLAQVPNDVPIRNADQMQTWQEPESTLIPRAALRTMLSASSSSSDRPNVNVSNTNGNEAEVSIAVNPNNRDNQVIVGHAPGFNTMATYFSTDGGRNWTAVPLGDAQDGRSSTFRFDPTVAFAGDGNVYAGYGLDDADGNRYLIVARSTDGGASYDQFTIVEIDNSLDKWIIGTGPDTSVPGQFNVYIAYRITESGNVNIRLASSYDQGTTFSVDRRVNDGGDLNTFGMPAVGPNGEVYVVWDDQTNRPNSSAIRVDVSTDNGDTWGTDRLVSTTPVTRGNTTRYDIPAQPSRGILAVPSIAVDRSGGPFHGRVYVAYTTVGSGGFNDTDIAVRFSDNSGVTWSAETIVNDDGGSTSQFLPWLDVDQITGQVVVVWYDARNDPTNNQMVEVFLGVSNDGGASFDNILVSDGQSDQSGGWANDYLEYIGVAALGGAAFPVWADNSITPNLDFFTDQIGIGNPPVADAGADQTIECEGHHGTEVTLDGSGSSDPDGDALTYTWRIGDNIIAGPTANAIVQVTLPLGVHLITLEVDDGNYLTDTDDVQVTIEDTIAPTIALNPPLEIELECGVDTYADFEPGAEVSDICDPTPSLDIDASDVDESTPGDYVVVYTAEDASGNSAVENRAVKVVDTLPPTITVNSEPTVLWPPNHAYWTISLDDLDIEVEDFCDKTLLPEHVTIALAWSDEPENARGNGDGNTLDDIVLTPGSRTIDLRAERQGGGNGRVYTLRLELTDASGNTGHTFYQVHVPRDLASALAIDDGCAYSPNASCEDLESMIAAYEAGSDQRDALDEIPIEFRLHQNHPNPFNPTTTISYDMIESAHVRLAVFNLLGQEVARLVDGPQQAGRHEVRFEAHTLPSGMYVYVLEAGGDRRTKTMILMK